MDIIIDGFKQLECQNCPHYESMLEQFGRVPKPPKIEKGLITIQGYLLEDHFAVCPRCDFSFGNLSYENDYNDKVVNRHLFCPGCGQAIDWTNHQRKD